MNVMAGSLGGLLPPIRTDALSVVSLAVNGTCNLACRHCYLAPEGPAVGLDAASWMRLVRSALVTGVEVLCFSGKEVFSQHESTNLLFEALRLRDLLQPTGGRRTRIGVVTNGTLLHRHREQLLATPPDWIDISLDGERAIHDQIRGQGAFEKTAANLPWLLDALGDRVWVTLTLMAANLACLPQTVAGLSGELGLQRFAVGLYRALPYTDRSLRLAVDRTAAAVWDAIGRLADLPCGDPIEVHMGFDVRDEACRQLLEDRGLLSGPGPMQQGSLAFPNDVTVRLAAMTTPVGLWRAVRVTNEGHLVGAEDLVDASRYAECAVADVRAHAFDMGRLRQACLKHPRFQALYGVPASSFLSQVDNIGTGGRGPEEATRRDAPA